MCTEVVTEALVSRKGVVRENWSEGSETTKSGTDEQKLYMRLSNLRVSWLISVTPQNKGVPTFGSRYSRYWRKENALTRGSLKLGSVS